MKMIILYIICLSLFLAGCVSPWGQLSDAGSLSTTPDQLIKKKVREPVRIAVNKIISKNEVFNEREVGRRFSDSLMRALINDNAFKVVSRTELDRVLEEQTFGLSGFVDPSSAAEIGKLAGAEAIIIGNIALASHFESGYPLKYVKVEVELQLIDTETAELIALISSTGFDEYDYLLEKEDTDTAINRAVDSVYADVHNYTMKWYHGVYE